MPLKSSELIREMQLVGVGFSSNDWNKLVNQLQIHIPSQLNTKLYEINNCTSETKKWSSVTEKLSEDILNHNPDWILFSPKNFESTKNCLDLLDKVQLSSRKRISLAMVIQSIQEEIYSILHYNPTFELINKMWFKISDPEFILNHHIPRFPRIPINANFKEIEYISDSGLVLKQNPDEIPLNTLIPLNKIRKIHTKNDQLSPFHSIRMLLSEIGKKTDPEQVVGILREAKACYLFPGIPFNSIKNVTIDNKRIEHLIKINECTEKYPPFRRFIARLINENTGEHKKGETIINHSSPKIICLCSQNIISNLVKKLLNRFGYTNVVILEEISPEDENLKNAEILLKFIDCKEFNFKGQIIDWCKDLDQILEQLSQFVFLNDIKSAVNTKPLKLKQNELEDLKEKLLETEKNTLKMNMHAESDQLLYSQEYDVLKNIEPFASLLSDALSSSTNWGNADKDASKIKLQRALLLCENEKDASEMNFKLRHVQRKLWINPFSIQKPEELTQLKSKIIRSYLNPGALIIKPAALKHLNKICLQTKQDCKIAKKTFNQQKEILKKTKSELKMIQNKKNKLALSLLETNLKKLLFRDIQLLHLDSDIVE